MLKKLTCFVVVALMTLMGSRRCHAEESVAAVTPDFALSSIDPSSSIEEALEISLGDVIEALRKDPDARLKIRAFTDKVPFRGVSEEENRVLQTRLATLRGAEVSRFYTDAGIDPARIDIIPRIYTDFRNSIVSVFSIPQEIHPEVQHASMAPTMREVRNVARTISTFIKNVRTENARPVRRAEAVRRVSALTPVPAAQFFIRPVDGRWSRGVSHGHKGVDIAVPKGTPVRASADGRVVIAEKRDTEFNGRFVELQHDNGGLTVVTFYLHLDRLNVRQGEFVRQGQIIGHSGNTGRVEGPNGGYHLHFQINGMENPFRKHHFH